MLKEYLSERNKSIYGIAKECGVPYSTLNDFVNGKVRVSECKAGMIRDVARVLGLTMDELYDMSENDTEPLTVVTSYGVPVTATINHKSFIAEFEYGGEHVTLKLCKVNTLNRFYLEEIAKWRAEEYIRGIRMKSFGPGWKP